MGKGVRDQYRGVYLWLLAVYLMIFAMVLIGGITRLTGSGLSMVEWRPLIGWLPPIGDAEWQAVFAKYKQFPQYQQVNSWMTLADFQRIFFWEYLHRLFGRLIGVVVMLPWLVLLARRKLNRSLAIRTGLAIVFGGLQGLLGWYMVRSGLVNEPAVSHYRLASHLMLAFFVACWVLWILFELRQGDDQPGTPSTGMRRFAWALVALITLQIVYGAFMAGKRAGFMYATFPTMNGEWIPSGLGAMTPGWRNALENPIGIHFIHRILGYLVTLVVFAFWFVARRSPDVTRRRAAHAMLLLIVLQMTLGILTVLTNVSIWIATAHQGLGFLLLSGALYAAYTYRGSAGAALPATVGSS
ncbi:MAG: heme A synthase [Proteobacteria bacterium]|nr:MAG: heme A synthase [Pseudomonadota bacterium]